jgi:hypothetical protein
MSKRFTLWEPSWHAVHAIVNQLCTCLADVIKAYKPTVNPGQTVRWWRLGYPRIGLASIRFVNMAGIPGRNPGMQPYRIYWVKAHRTVLQTDQWRLSNDNRLIVWLSLSLAAISCRKHRRHNTSFSTISDLIRAAKISIYLRSSRHVLFQLRDQHRCKITSCMNNISWLTNIVIVWVVMTSLSIFILLADCRSLPVGEIQLLIGCRREP